MIRLTLLLCGGLFLAMLIGGQDRGQQRFGLMPQSEPTVVVVEAPLASVAEIAATKAVFAPSQPVMDIPAVEETVVVEPGAVIPAEGRLLQVTAKSANVRSGPGKDFDVVGRLVRGESVLVVAEGDGPDGWALIRIEGDGVEGYIAARLLSE